MKHEKWIIPGVTLVFAAGVSLATFEAAAEDAKELQVRVGSLEVQAGKQEVIDLKIEGIETRLDKMEELQAQMLALQQQQAINQARICEATGASCR